tara:strand:- start:41279 stop:41986 length:708 start_codon:yes stop_codon:yes gene_type:complete
MKTSIIVSRFNEDLSWIKEFKEFKVIIYNKGKLFKNENFDKIININNVGRESHTWLYHIVKNYDNLDDINIFLQGRIDDLGCMAFSNPYKYIKKVNKYGFAASRYGIIGPLQWKWNIGIEKNKKYFDSWNNGEISKSKIGFRKFAKQLFPNIPKIIATSYGGCFAIKREVIRKYDINFYSNLLEKLNTHKNPIEGHYMERLWCYMFTENEPLLNAFFDVIHTKIERSRLKFIINK